MALLAAFTGRCRALLTEIAHEPARSLTTFMDGVDEIWALDAFMDPEPSEAGA